MQRLYSGYFHILFAWLQPMQTHSEASSSKPKREQKEITFFPEQLEKAPSQNFTSCQAELVKSATLTLAP